MVLVKTLAEGLGFYYVRTVMLQWERSAVMIC